MVDSSPVKFQATMILTGWFLASCIWVSLMMMMISHLFPKLMDNQGCFDRELGDAFVNHHRPIVRADSPMTGFRRSRCTKSPTIPYFMREWKPMLPTSTRPVWIPHLQILEKEGSVAKPGVLASIRDEASYSVLWKNSCKKSAEKQKNSALQIPNIC